MLGVVDSLPQMEHDAAFRLLSFPFELQTLQSSALPFPLAAAGLQIQQELDCTDKR